MPITSTILETARTHPDRPAIIGAEAGLSYAELVADSRRVYAAVDALHRARTEPVTPAPEALGIPITAISLTSAFHTARIIAGLAGYRAVSATIDPRWPLQHRLGVIVRTGIGLVISDSPELAEALAAADWTGTIVTSAEFFAHEAAAHPALVPTRRDDGEPFLMLFSSGTTSNPKAFIKTRGQYRANVAVSAAHLEPLPGVATLAPGPVSYSLTLYAVIESLATGGSIHLADEFDPITAGRRIAEEQVTRIVAVPAIVRSLAEAAARDPERFTGLDLVVTGGANLPASIRDRLAEVLPTTHLISYYGAAEIGFIGDSRAGDGTWISIYDTIGAEIRGEDGTTELPAGEIGTLWIDAAACSAGYVTGTAEVELKGPDGWASVNDQGRMVDGLLQLAGRAGDIAVTGGHKVSLPEVERAFDTFVPNAVSPVELGGGTVSTTGDDPARGDASNGELGEVCAVALPDAALGSIVALVIETEQPKTALQDHARTHLAPQFVPRRFYRLEELPRTVGGKIRRAETVDLIMNGQGHRL